MHIFLYFILALALGAVLVTLGMGFYALFRGGEFGRTWSNRLMRLRIVLQFTAIVVLVTVVWLLQRT